MAFIPIDAKADIEGSKKGKLTPAQHSQLNAWCLTKKTGILNCLNKCETTENVYTATNNIATVIFKSGYLAICGRIVECEEGTEVQVITPVSGTQTGYIVARYDLSANKEKEFEIITKTGALVQQDLNDNPITGVYELLLYSYTATATSVTLNRSIEYIKSVGDIVPRAVTAKYMEEIYLNPSASNPVDLNDLTEYGVYNINNYNEQVPYVYNSPEKSVGRIIVSSFLLKETDSSVKTPYNVMKQEYYTTDNYYYRYSVHDSATGEHTGWTDWVKVGVSTIEERLSRLGFKSGVMQIFDDLYGSEENTDTTSNGIFRLGNFVIAKAVFDKKYTTTLQNKYFINGSTVLTIPEGFRPKTTTYAVLFGRGKTSVENYALRIQINTDGRGIAAYSVEEGIDFNDTLNWQLVVGFEAPPMV